MTRYYIHETTHFNALRKGEPIEANSLTDAKRKASRAQMFQSTVLQISSEWGQPLCVKEDGRWRDLSWELASES